MARVPLLDAEDLPEEYRYLFDQNDVGTADIFRGMANAPTQFQWYMRYSSRLWEILPARERELVILAAARALEHPYEWHQHVRLGREAGVSDEEITAISEGRGEPFDAQDAALLTYARAVALGDVRDGDHDRLREEYDDEIVVGVAMLAAHYVATARVLDAMGIEPEEEFVGWQV